MRAWLVIGALALALVAPAAFMPPMVHDSFWIDWTWADQFTEQIRRGVVYPRMLPDANNGAGSATLYFYPPLAFYVTAILGLVGVLIRWRSAWAGYALALCALAAGLVPFFWSLPIIEKVQFPIRVLPLAELALAAAIASAGWLALVAAAVPALGVLAADFTQPKAGTFPTIAELRVTREDVPENRLTRPLPVPNIPARLGALTSLLSLLILVTRSGAALARQRRADQTPSS